MAQINNFSTVRAVSVRRQQLSYKLAQLSRALSVCTCLVAMALVFASVLGAGPVLVPFVVAVIATLSCAPLWVISHVLIRAQWTTMSKWKNSRRARILL